jgi:hypothetical protein
MLLELLPLPCTDVASPFAPFMQLPLLLLVEFMDFLYFFVALMPRVPSAAMSVCDHDFFESLNMPFPLARPPFECSVGDAISLSLEVNSLTSLR